MPFKERGLFQERLFTKIPNGVEEPHTPSISRSDLGIPEDSFVICLVSRARFDKGWVEAADAVEHLNLDSPREIHLIMAGNGEAYDYLKQRGSRYVHLLGFHPAPTDLFTISDIGILPSYYSGESFPLSVLECLSTGTPMISTNLGEIPDILTDGGGDVAGIIIRMEKGDSKTIEDAISTAMDDRDRYGRMCRTAENLKLRYDIDRIADDYLAHYRNLLRRVSSTSA